MSSSPRSRPSALSVGVIAVTATALAEGAVAATASLHGHGGGVAAAASFAAATAIISASLFIVVLPIGALVGGRGMRGLARHVRDATGGSAAAAAIALSSTLAAAVVVGALVGVRALDLVTPPFAVSAATLASLGAFFIGAIVFFPVATRLARAMPIAARSPWAPVLLCLSLSLAVAAAIGATELPTTWAAAPVAFIAGTAIAIAPGASSLAARLGGVTPGVWIVLALIGCAALTIANLGSLPPAARAGITSEAPYTANVMATLFKATDRDGDGYSPLFFGGDCNDVDPLINPGARDVPDNGVDENCADGDAPRWSPPVEPSGRPDLEDGQNVVLILLDALRPDHMSFNGYERPTTPQIDRFREESVDFENAYTIAPATRFALATAFTGDDARRLPHRLTKNRYRLSNGAPTVARKLARAEYDTIGFTISYVMHHSPSLGQGFASFETPWPSREYRDLYPEMAERTTTAALDYLAETPQDGSKKYFVFAHYRCTHSPYHRYEQWDYGETPIDRYDSALNHCDEQIGVLLDALRARGDWGRTSVILFSDHGELFGEFGATHHSYTVHEPELRMALLLRVPGVPSGTVTTPVTIGDIAPTIYELTGIPRPAELPSWSLLVHLGPDAPREASERPIFFFTDMWRARVHRESRGVIVWPYKYIYDVLNGRRSVFDLDRDPGEEHDLAEQDEHRAADLAHVLEVYESFRAED